MTSAPSPWPVGLPPHDVDLERRVFAWRDGQPVLFEMTGAAGWFIACFDDADGLRAFHARTDVPFDSIKQIVDGAEFLASVAGVATIILNPRFTPEGRVRFTYVLTPHDD